ncbi:hypothetical protein [Streptomyces wuyuanensis]
MSVPEARARVFDLIGLHDHHTLSVRMASAAGLLAGCGAASAP